tara:strand:- start:1218 stop:2057 length:840 start_codon:yes stop_codon:yes gene_type:complete
VWVRANGARGETAVSGRAVADRDVERGAGAASTAEGAKARGATSTKARGCVEVVVATEDEQFEIAATLRATAFYDDLLERGEMPFPARFTATFHREFAQRERRALRERTTRKVGPALESTCYMAECEGMGLVGCLDASVREGPCASQINGVCVREGTSYAYVDNVAVDAGARRRGSARLMMECASDFAEERGFKEIWTHVHCENLGARALYHAFGFRAPSGTFPENGLPNYFNGERLKGLILLRAPVPLVYMDRVEERCGCGAFFDGVSECICSKPQAR